MITNPDCPFKSVQELFALRARWTQFTFSRSASREPCGINDGIAQCWCLTGAIIYVYGYISFGEAMVRVREALNLTAGQGVAGWNDKPTRTFEDVVEIVKKAQI